jgi:hypothetical protein
MTEIEKSKTENMENVIWFQLEIDQLKLEIDYENSTVKKVNLEECDDIYSKLFYWSDHHRVSDGDVQVVKQFFKDKFVLKYFPNILVRDCKELGYPVVFEILEKYKTTYFLYMTYDGIIHNIRSDHFNPKYKNTGLSCLRYNQNFDDFDFWISQNGEITLDSSCNEPHCELPARNSRMNDNKLVLKYFISNNKIPDRLIELWDDELYVTWKVKRNNKKIGMAVKNTSQTLSQFIKGVYIQSYFSENYVQKCLETFQTELDMSDTVENFISSDLGKKSKKNVPNPKVEYVYNLNFSNFLK